MSQKKKVSQEVVDDVSEALDVYDEAIAQITNRYRYDSYSREHQRLLARSVMESLVGRKLHVQKRDS